MLHRSKTLALTTTVNSHFRATRGSLINIFTLTQELLGLTLQQRTQIVLCHRGRRGDLSQHRQLQPLGENHTF